MASNFAVFQGGIGTGSGTVDLTTTNMGGATPKAAILLASRATTNGSEAAHAELSIGFTDGTLEYNTAGNVEDGTTSTDAVREVANTSLIQLHTPGGTAVNDGVAEFSSFITNGIRVDRTNAFPADVLVQGMFFGGSDVSVKAGHFTAGNSGTSNDITTIGFEPDVVFFGSGGRSLNTSGGDLRDSFGVAINDVGVSQYAEAHKVNDGDAIANPERVAFNTGAAGSTSNSSRIAISDFDANGFTATVADGNAGFDVFYLALKITGKSFWLDEVSSPTATGDQAFTGPAFQPDILISSFTTKTAYGLDQGDTSQPYYIYAADGTTESMIGYRVEDAADPQVAKSFVDDSITVYDDAGTTLYVGSLSSFDSNGWTWNWTTEADSTARKWWALAIGESGGATTYTETSTGNAFLKKIGVTKTATGNSFLKLTGLTKTATGNSYLQKAGLTETFTANAILQQVGLTATATADAFLKAIGVTDTATANAVLKKLGLTKTSTANALLQISGLTETATANAFLKLTGISKTATADAFLKLTGVTRTATGNALLKLTGVSKTATGNSFLKLTGLTETATGSGFLEATAPFTTAADTTSISANAYVQTGTNRIFVVYVFARGGDVNSASVTGITLDSVDGTYGANEFYNPDGTRHNVVAYYWLDTNMPTGPGLYTVAATMSAGTDNDLIMGWHQLDDVSLLVQQAPEATGSTNLDNVTAIDTDITTVTAFARVIDGVMHYQTGASFTDTDPTSRKIGEQSQTAISAAMGTFTQDSAGAISPDWSSDQSAEAMVSVALAFERTVGTEYTVTATGNAILQEQKTLTATGNAFLELAGVLNTTANGYLQLTDNTVTTDANGYLQLAGNTATTTANGWLLIAAADPYIVDDDTTLITGTATVSSGSNRVFLAFVTVTGDRPGEVVSTSCTLNGVSGTASVDEFLLASGGPRYNMDSYYWLESDLPAAGDYTIEATFAEGADNQVILAWHQLNNIVQQAPEATASREAEDSTEIDRNLTTLTSGARVIDSVMHAQQAVTFTDSTPSGRKQFTAEQTDITTAVGEFTQVTAGAIAPKWTSDQPAETLVQLVLAFEAFDVTLYTKTATANAILQEQKALTATGGAYLKTTDKLLAVTANAFLSGDTDERLIAVTANGYLRIPGLATCTANAILFNGLTCVANGILRKAKPKTVTANAYLIQKPGYWDTRTRDSITWSKR